MKRTKRTYDASDKNAALAAIARGESPAKVAASLSVPRTTIYRWLEAAKQGNAPALAAPQASDETKRLRDEVRELRAKLSVMRQALAIMAGQ